MRARAREETAAWPPASASEGDERTLLARVREGDEAAFEVIFRTHAESLYRYAHRLVKSRAVAEELVHDVFTRIWVQRQEWSVDQTVAAYLHRAVRNHAFNHGRRQLRESAWMRESVADIDAEGRHAIGAQELVHCQDLASAVEAALPQLTPRCREMYLLHRQHHLSYAEIAQVLGLSQKTVEHNVARALKALRSLLTAYLVVAIALVKIG